MGTKISALSQVTSITTTDLILVSQDTGGGTFASKKVNRKDLTKGSLLNVYSTTSNYTAALTDDVILVSNTAAIFLPASIGNGHVVNIKNISNASSSTIVPSGSDKVDGATGNVTSIAYSNTMLIDATTGNWYIL